DFLEQQQAFARIVRVRRQPKVHRDDGWLAAAHLGDRRLSVAGDDRFVPVECPAHLFLQLRIVLDDQQRPARFGHAVLPAAGALTSPRGNSTRTRVPCPGSLSTSIRPPRPATYCELS